MQNFFRKINWLIYYFVILLAFCLPALPQSGKWIQEEGGRIRISFDAQPNKRYENMTYGLIEVELKAGWKTYWKNPGSSGFAPELNITYAGSKGGDKRENLETKLLFPIPMIIPEKEGKGVIIGYQERLDLPFRVDLPAKTGAISGHLLIGLCKEICVPVGIDFSFNVNDFVDFPTKGRIEAALAMIH